MKKRLLSLLLVMALIIGMMPTAVYATEGGTVGFSDMPKDWSTIALENALKNGLMQGYDGKIMPNGKLTRAQMAAVINRAFGAAQKTSLSSYTDVSKSAWYYDDMARAVHMKTFKGGGNGKLNPDRDITREEAFVVLANAFKLSGAKETVLDQFSDKDSVSTWSKKGTASLVYAGYVAGSKGKLNPKQNITRAEFAKLMDNLLKNYIKKAGTYTSDMKGNLIINVPNVTLKNMTIKGDLIIGDGVGDGDITLNNVTVTGRTVIRGGGDNSIKIIGNSNLQRVIIARVDGDVRVFAEDGIEIGEVIVDGSDDVIIEGNVEDVRIIASDITMTAANAEIASIKIEGEDLEIKVPKGSKVEKVIVNGDGSDISGTGKVGSVEVNASHIKVKTIGTKVIAAKGTSDVLSGTVAVAPGKTVIVGKKSSGKRSSGGSSGGNSGGNSGGDTSVVVGAITITTSSGDVTGLPNDAVVTVTLQTATAGAAIYYTVDGSTPTAQSTLYDSNNKPTVKTAKELGETVVIKAIGIKTGMSNSAIAAKSIVFNAATSVNVSTAAQLKSAIENNNVNKINITGSFTGDVIAARTDSNNLTIDFHDKSMTGNLGITANSATKITLDGTAAPSIEGNLTVSAANATVYNNIDVNGAITIEAVSSHTWNQNGDAEGIEITANGGAFEYTSGTITNGVEINPTANTNPIILEGNLSAIPVSIQAPSTVEIDSQATPPSINIGVNAGGTDIENFSPNSASITANANATVGGAATVTPAEGVTVKQRQVRPIFTPAAGAVALGTTVTIISSEADTIYYTTDGSDPTTASTNQRTKTLVISEPMTVKAIAVKADKENSSIATAVYTQAATADITNIVLSGTPTGFNFVGDTYTYENITVPHSQSSITVTPTGTGTITVNGTSVTSGETSIAIDLTAGQDKAITVVAKEEGKSAKTYTITVTRIAPKEITGAKAINDVKATINDGTTLDNIKTTLGNKVALLAGTEEVEVQVTWSVDTAPTYNNATAGTYVLTGTIGQLPDGYADAVDTIATVTAKIVIEQGTSPTQVAPVTNIRYQVNSSTMDAELVFEKPQNTTGIQYYFVQFSKDGGNTWENGYDEDVAVPMSEVARKMTTTTTYNRVRVISCVEEDSDYAENEVVEEINFTFNVEGDAVEFTVAKVEDIKYTINLAEEAKAGDVYHLQLIENNELGRRFIKYYVDMGDKNKIQIQTQAEDPIADGTGFILRKITNATSSSLSITPKQTTPVVADAAAPIEGIECQSDMILPISAANSDAVVVTITGTQQVITDVTWTSSNTNVATVDSNTGIINPVAAGRTNIVATLKSDNTKTATCTLEVRAEAHTATPIDNGAENPSIVVSLSGDTFTTNGTNKDTWTIDVGTTGLIVSQITLQGNAGEATSATISFTGTAKAGEITILPKKEALTAGIDPILVPVKILITQGIGNLTVSAEDDNTNDTNTIISVIEVNENHTRLYKNFGAGQVILPALDTVLTAGTDSWVVFPANGSITATNGDKIVVVDTLTADNRAKFVGQTLAVVEAQGSVPTQVAPVTNIRYVVNSSTKDAELVFDKPQNTTGIQYYFVQFSKDDGNTWENGYDEDVAVPMSEVARKMTTTTTYNRVRVISCVEEDSDYAENEVEAAISFTFNVEGDAVEFTVAKVEDIKYTINLAKEANQGDVYHLQLIENNKSGRRFIKYYVDMDDKNKIQIQTQAEDPIAEGTGFILRKITNATSSSLSITPKQTTPVLADTAPTPKEITGAKAIDDVKVTTNDGTTLDSIKTDLGNTVALLAGAEEVAVPVTWSTDTAPAYNNAKAGTYVLTGTMGQLPDGYVDETDKIDTVAVNVVVAGEALKIIAATITKNPADDSPKVGDVLTLEVTMSDGQLAGNRVEYFAAVQETKETTEAIGYINIDKNSNTFTIPATYIDDNDVEQSIIGKFIDFGVEIVDEGNSGMAAKRVGPIQ